MGKKEQRLRSNKILDELFEEWGMPFTSPPKSPPQGSVTVVLRLKNKIQLTVGTLSFENKSFVFRYSNEFKESGLPPLPGFPDVNKSEYKSPILWPFFQVRIPPLSREDVARVMEKYRLSEKDIFEKLRILGNRTIASPYEFVSKN